MSETPDTNPRADSPGPTSAQLEMVGLITADHVRIWENERHILNIEVDDEIHEDVRAVKTFPLSGKAPYISFIDDRDKEKALLADPDNLDDESKRHLDAALDKMYYVATIQRVFSISETMGVSQWEVETDRGYATFEVVGRRQKIRSLPGERYVITDVDGNRFEIPNLYELDPRSQNLVMSET